MTTLARAYQLNYFDPAENSNKVWISKAYSDERFESNFGHVREYGFGWMRLEKKPSSHSADAPYLAHKGTEKIRRANNRSLVLSGRHSRG